MYTDEGKVNLRKERVYVSRKGWYPIVVIGITMILLTVITMAYARKLDSESDRQNQKNDQKWCTLLVELDDAYRSGPPPTTETGRRVAEAIHQRRVDLGC